MRHIHTSCTHLYRYLTLHFLTCTGTSDTTALPLSLKVLCAAAVNTAMFFSDHVHAVKVSKESDVSTATEEDKTMSLLWVCTGVTNLSKVRDTKGREMYQIVHTYIHASPAESV